MAPGIKLGAPVAEAIRAQCQKAAPRQPEACVSNVTAKVEETLRSLCEKNESGGGKTLQKCHTRLASTLWDLRDLGLRETVPLRSDDGATHSRLSSLILYQAHAATRPQPPAPVSPPPSGETPKESRSLSDLGVELFPSFNDHWTVVPLRIPVLNAEEEIEIVAVDFRYNLQNNFDGTWSLYWTDKNLDRGFQQSDPRVVLSLINGRYPKTLQLELYPTGWRINQAGE